MVTLAVGVRAFATEAFVSSGSWLPSRHAGWRGGAELPETAARVHQGGVCDGNSGINGPRIVLKMKPVQGFMPVREVTPAELNPCKPVYNKQKLLFFNFVNEGHAASEVFVRFEGFMSWKPLGEIVSANGDFEEAVKAQWRLLVEHSYYRWKKVHFLLPRAQIQFGYTDEDSKIVVVSRAYAEGSAPVKFRKRLQRSGFLGDEKPDHWRHMYTKFRERKDVRKGYLSGDFQKAHLLDRAYNHRLASYKRYNKDKYRGRYTDYMDVKKRGLVVGNSASR